MNSDTAAIADTVAGFAASIEEREECSGCIVCRCACIERERCEVEKHALERSGEVGDRNAVGAHLQPECADSVFEGVQDGAIGLGRRSGSESSGNQPTGIDITVSVDATHVRKSARQALLGTLVAWAVERCDSDTVVGDGFEQFLWLGAQFCRIDSAGLGEHTGYGALPLRVRLLDSLGF